MYRVQKKMNCKNCGLTCDVIAWFSTNGFCSTECKKIFKSKVVPS